MLKKNTKQKILLLSLTVIMAFSVVGTIAFIATHTESINNTFNPATVSCQVLEENFGRALNGNVTKENVTIKNTGDVPAYIRAKFVITWQDSEGNVLGVNPVKDTDYKIELGSDKWLEKDGIYYYKEVVPAEGNDETEALIESCEALKECEQDGYFLNVEIIASAIQADGKMDSGVKAVVDAWGER